MKVARSKMKAALCALLILVGISPALAATKVAVIVPLTGALAASGKEIEATSKAWAARVNSKAGGTVELLVLDDKSSADGARDAARQAVAQGAALVMNCFGSVACMAIAQELKAPAVPLIGAIAGDDRLRGPDLPHVFTTRVGARDEVEVVIKYLQGVRLSDLLVIYQDDGFGQSYKRALDEALKSRPDVRIAATLGLDPARKDYAAVAKQAMAKPSLGVLLLANTPNSIGLIEAMKEAGYRGIYFNLAAQANPVFVERMGKLTAEHKLVAAFVTMTPSPTLPMAGVASYRETIASHGQSLAPTYLGLESYVNASLTGALIGKDPKPTPDAVAKLLGKDLQGINIAGLPVKFDPSRRQAVRWLNLSAVSSDGRVRSY